MVQSVISAKVDFLICTNIALARYQTKSSPTDFKIPSGNKENQANNNRR